MSRPRSQQAHDHVLKTALGLFAERGIDGTSMDAISLASGVSKATIYKHWQNKDELCIEAVSSLKGEIPQCDSGHPRADLTRLLDHFCQFRKPGTFGRIWPQVVGYAASNPQFAKTLREQILRPRRAAVIEIVKRAIDKGELRRDLDASLAADLLLGPVIYRRFMDMKLPPAFACQVIGAFWRAHAAKCVAIRKEFQRKR